MASHVTTRFPFDLTTTELALLTMTNEGAIPRPDYRPFIPHEPIILTDKGAYLWAALIDRLLEANPSLEENQLTSAYRRAVQARERALKIYQQIPFANWDSVPLDEQPSSLTYPFLLLAPVFVAELRAPDNLLPVTFEASRTAYLSLERKGLIEDPITTTVLGIPLAVAGFVPYNFTQRTRRGRTIYRKVTALFWHWEMHDEHGVRQHNFHFKLWKAVDAFRKALVEETEDVLEAPDEP